MHLFIWKDKSMLNKIHFEDKISFHFSGFFDSVGSSGAEVCIRPGQPNITSQCFSESSSPIYFCSECSKSFTSQVNMKSEFYIYELAQNFGND